MKKILTRHAVILGLAIIVSVVLTLIVTTFDWSFNTFSDMLTYSGVVVLAYGTFVASNMSNWFTKTKRNLNERYSPEDKLDKEKQFNNKLKEGWIIIATGCVIVILSILVV